MKDHNSNNRKFTSRPRYLVCALRQYGSDDSDECSHRGDDFRRGWMRMRVRKCNADYGSTPKKELKFLSPPSMKPIITKSKFQASEANASLSDSKRKCKILSADNDAYFNNNAT